MDKLTTRQSEILSFLQEFMEEAGMPPTRAEIARALGFRSVNAAEEHLRALQRKGAIITLVSPDIGEAIEAGNLDIEKAVARWVTGRSSPEISVVNEDHSENRIRLITTLKKNNWFAASLLPDTFAPGKCTFKVDV